MLAMPHMAFQICKIFGVWGNKSSRIKLYIIFQTGRHADRPTERKTCIQNNSLERHANNNMHVFSGFKSLSKFTNFCYCWTIAGIPHSSSCVFMMGAIHLTKGLLMAHSVSYRYFIFTNVVNYFKECEFALEPLIKLKGKIH